SRFARLLSLGPRSEAAGHGEPGVETNMATVTAVRDYSLIVVENSLQSFYSPIVDQLSPATEDERDAEAPSSTPTGLIPYSGFDSTSTGRSYEMRSRRDGHRRDITFHDGRRA